MPATEELPSEFEPLEIDTAGQLARPIPPVPPTLSSESARDLFTRDTGLLVLPVVDGRDEVVGVLNRFRFLERFAARFGRELVGRKPVSQLMEPPLRLDVGTPIDRVGSLLLKRQSRNVFDGFVVTRNGRYAGVGTGFDLIRAFTERRHQELQRRALHDPLTGLPNRELFERRLSQITDHDPADRIAAVLFLDLDRFKEINDTYGHRFGDLVLCAVASRLRAAVRRHDLVARLSGDEFAVVLEGLTDPDEACRVAQVLVASCSAPLAIDRHEVAVSCSIGVAVYPQHARMADRLARAADAALYRAKDVRNHWQAYAPEMEEMRAPALTVSALRLALDQHALDVHYQPVVCLRTHRVTGVEALIRWTHPTEGVVPASQIVKLAEDSGLIIPLGAFVLEAAVAQVLEWDRLTGRTDLTLAVNVSAVQVHEGSLVAMLDRVVTSTGFDPRRLELEFTETGALRGSTALDRTFQALKARGFVLTIDDFGTGYSALSRLERLPIDGVKIDRSFVHGIGTERRGGTIARAVVAIGHSLGLQVVAEGVETEQQRAFLAAAGCHRAQGFLLGRPVAGADLTSMLSKGESTARPA